MKDDRESRKQALLKELGDIQSLLDDMESSPSTNRNSALDSEQIRKLASERTNPFLSTANPAPAQPAPQRPQQKLSPSEIEQIVDSLVTEALPKLEQALRMRLRDALRRKN
ncbi:hypothetical protein Y5S_01466 [Alcanivorax nanhaiticus]|uniref:Uncharacterized protein n=1 Tax=Alcanivorax nanhaiticus TaxID=1177154 RepID=A0A095TT78_9GAMM|nr:hypothetical protein [Alcanivorax nanhaiticus]KGD65573.1 hypothetical protein Y5S_01466 [Alcanivorax nanhaiticus]